MFYVFIYLYASKEYMGYADNQEGCNCGRISGRSYDQDPTEEWAVATTVAS